MTLQINSKSFDPFLPRLRPGFPGNRRRGGGSNPEGMRELGSNTSRTRAACLHSFIHPHLARPLA